MLTEKEIIPITGYITYQRGSEYDPYAAVLHGDSFPPQNQVSVFGDVEDYSKGAEMLM